MRNMFDTAATSFLLASVLFQEALAAVATKQCNLDKCLSAVESDYYARPQSHVPGCHEYLNRVHTPPIVTVHHTGTVTTTTTLSVTKSQEDVTTVSTAVTPVVSTSGPAPTTTVVVKRLPNGGPPGCPTPSADSTPAVPTLASSCKALSAFVSACSCLGITTSTTTLPACTTTIHDTPETVTVTVKTTTDVVQYSTTVVTSTAPPTTTTVNGPATTVFSVPPISSCTTIQADNGLPYSVYFSGAGYTEDPNNPGNFNPDYPPVTTSFPGTLDPCGAINSCANYAADNSDYSSFDVHYLASTDGWTCVAYDAGNTNPSYFDQANSDVIAVYGFTFSTAS